MFYVFNGVRGAFGDDSAVPDAVKPVKLMYTQALGFHMLMDACFMFGVIVNDISHVMMPSFVAETNPGCADWGSNNSSVVLAALSTVSIDWRATTPTTSAGMSTRTTGGTAGAAATGWAAAGLADAPLSSLPAWGCADAFSADV